MQSCSGDSLAQDPNVRMITLYDNEEVSEADPEPFQELLELSDEEQGVECLCLVSNVAVVY